MVAGLLPACLLVFATAAQADVSNNFASVSSGSSVQAHGCCIEGPNGCEEVCYCSAVNGPFLTSTDLNFVLQNLTSELLADGQALNTGQMQQLQAQQALDNQALQENVNNQNALAVAEAAVHYQNSVSPDIPASAPLLSGCANTAMFQGLSQGISNGQQIAAEFAGFSAQVNAGVPSGMEAQAALAKADPMTLTANTILPSAQTLSAEYPTTQEMAEAITHITNPLPPVRITQGQSWTPAGSRWQALHHAQEAKLSAAQGTLSQIAAWHTPTAPAGAFITLYANTQAAVGNTVSGAQKNVPANPPGVALENGQAMISPDGALNLMMLARYANPQWYLALAQENPAGIAKENSEMGALSLRAGWESLRSLEHITQILAVRYANKAVSPATAQLNGLAGNAMAEEDGGLNGQ